MKKGIVKAFGVWYHLNIKYIVPVHDLPSMQWCSPGGIAPFFAYESADFKSE